MGLRRKITRERARGAGRDLVGAQIGAARGPERRCRSDRGGRGLWRRFLFLLRGRRLLHRLLLARRGTALCLLGFLRYVQPPDRFIMPRTIPQPPILTYGTVADGINS